jgi:hypothetical protein
MVTLRYSPKITTFLKGPIYNSNTFTGLMELCTKYDFDARTYEIFYRLGGSGQWTSCGSASPLNGQNMGNAIRLTAGDTTSAGTGSWADAGEYFHIGSIYLTKSDPTVEPQNQAPTVDISYPHDGDSFASVSDITLQAIAHDNDGNVASVEFYNGATLLGQGSSPAVQPIIVNTAVHATIHGSTAQYISSQNCIVYRTNANDWLSWTATIVRPDHVRGLGKLLLQHRFSRFNLSCTDRRSKCRRNCC